MLEASRQKILASVPPEARVLDVGGWAEPLGRANWVIDLMPYETRGLYGHAVTPGEERFSAESWVQRDICDHEPWPFADDEFDFVVCAHTLEDVRDPIQVCAELNRVGRAGYIEVPSRLEEQSLGIQGPWVGWGHHHWLIDSDERSLTFVFKHHVLHGRASDHFPIGFGSRLLPEQRVQCLWWTGGFEYRERIILGAEELDSYLADFVAANRASVELPAPGAIERLRSLLR